MIVPDNLVKEMAEGVKYLVERERKVEKEQADMERIIELTGRKIDWWAVNPINDYR